MEKAVLISAVLIFQFNLLFAQLKYEREYRLEKTQVPEQALDFVRDFGFTSKVKWYREEGLNQQSIEAKTRYKKEKYSIEFDTSGIIEDIEIEIEIKRMPAETRDAINRFLESSFRKHKICKIQQQFTGDARSLLQIKNKRPVSSTQQVSVFYEWVVKGKRKDEHQMLELLFDESGNLLKESVIIFENTDNLEY